MRLLTVAFALVLAALSSWTASAAKDPKDCEVSCNLRLSRRSAL